MAGTTLAAYLHAQMTDIWEVLALIGPFAIVFGAGVVLIIMPIVRAQGERYQHRELRAGEQETSANGNGAGAHAGAVPAAPADKPIPTPHSKN